MDDIEQAIADAPIHAPKKRITVTDIVWFYAAPTPSGFASNAVVLMPGDTRVPLVENGRVVGEQFTFARRGSDVTVPRTWLWREEYTREVEVREK